MNVKELDALVALKKRQMQKRKTMKDRVENANFNKHMESCATCRRAFDQLLEAQAFEDAGRETFDLMKTLRTATVH